MRFEYDPGKSSLNRQKHGIDFDEIQELWDDPQRIEIPARTEDEPRFLVIGKQKGVYWSCVIIYRGETVRIISARRSRTEEVRIYESP